MRGERFHIDPIVDLGSGRKVPALLRLPQGAAPGGLSRLAKGVGERPHVCRSERHHEKLSLTLPAGHVIEGKLPEAANFSRGALAYRSSYQAQREGDRTTLQVTREYIASCQTAAGELNEAVRKLEDEGALPEDVYAAQDELPDFPHSWTEDGRLQRAIDGARMTKVLASLAGFVEEGAELEISGTYDDESGYEFNSITLGPLVFNTDYYVWNEDGVLALLGDRNKLAAFVERFAPQADDLEVEFADTPEAIELVRDPKGVDEDTARAGIAAISGRYEWLEDSQDVDYDLGVLYDVTERTFRACAPLSNDTDSVTLWWVKARCT